MPAESGDKVDESEVIGHKTKKIAERGTKGLHSIERNCRVLAFLDYFLGCRAEGRRGDTKGMHCSKDASTNLISQICRVLEQ